VLILLPPSEGKSVPRRGAPLRPADWPPPLREARFRVVDALTSLCAGDESEAVRVLGVGPGQVDEVRRNVSLLGAPSAAAERVYAGVLYKALGLSTLGPSAHRRALSRIGIVSSVFGLVGPGERIAPYRLAGGVSLPGLGGVAAHWRDVLDPVVRERARGGLVVDLRSSTYGAFWRPSAELSKRVATVRVLHEANGRRQVVSHFNKATKGRLVRNLLEDGRDPRTPAAFAAVLDDLGWRVERDGTRLDVVVSEL
jgi:cytoplasmic iron level regulating protein YaaA (DUF328/UPF0246 family)